MKNTCSDKDCKCCCHNDECDMQEFKEFCKRHGRKGMHGYGHPDGGGGAVYGLGVIGAAIFFIGNASTFWLGVLGLLKAIVWPVFMVLEAFKTLIG